MTLLQIAELISERAGRQFDTAFNMEMQDLVVAHRARYITNKVQKNPTLGNYYVQSAIVDLKEVGKDECEGLAECNCENVLVTVDEDGNPKKIPRPIVFGTHPFNYVGSPTGVQPFGWTTFGTEKYLAASPITGKKQRHTYLNEYIYVFNDRNLDKLRFEGIYADPRVLGGFKCNDGSKPCYSESLDFPIDDELIEPIINQIVNSILNRNVEEKQEIKVGQNV